MTTQQTGSGSSKGAAFVTHFVPGLIIGLLIGALAGAFLTPVLEGGAPKLPAGTGASSSSSHTTEGRERLPDNTVDVPITNPDDTQPKSEPVDPAAPQQPPADPNAPVAPKPVEPKPAEPKPSEPAPK
jgi:hypothetical protein